MGGKSKPTIGYWYRYLLHFGLSQVLDALLEMRGGDRTAWAGRAEGGTVTIDARELWGGEKAEGGIEGELDVMLGDADQLPNARLTSVLGDQQSAYRGRASVAFEGLYGAFNPYPKAPAFKGLRIFSGWEDDTVWYPEKARIVVGAYNPMITSGYFRVSAGAVVGNSGVVYETVETGFTATAHAIAQYCIDARNAATGSTYTLLEAFTYVGSGGIRYVGATSVELGNDIGIAAVAISAVCPSGYETSFEENGTGSPLGVTEPTIVCTLDLGDVEAMNPAHIIYDSLTHSSMQGEPVDLIDAASFAAAADLFFDEGFGLCTKYDPASETVEAFQQRICSVVGANLARSRVDGRYYLTPVRGSHDLESLPILEDDDILEYEEEASDPLESVNQVVVEWFDPVKKKKRSTTPVQSLGSIQSAGGVVAEVASYPEIPYEELALRVAARDLAQKAPLKRFRLTTNRVPYAWRAGDYFRLQAPRRGIADMVCMVGEIDAGTPRSGSMRLVAIQDVSGMPTTVYVVPEPGVDTSPSQAPAVPEHQRLVEAPYVELAGDLPSAELLALPLDAGFALALASRPSSGLNFTLLTAATGETLTDRGSGDWCPTATVVEAATRDPGQVAFTLAAGSDLSLVAAGSAALWGAELVRVDAIDPVALTVTLGRGCGDTTPQLHPAGERIWFYDLWSASDRRQYASGETVIAKVLTRTPSRLLDPGLAPTLELVLNERAGRPYPPGRLRISDDVVADAVDPSACVGEITATWAFRDRLVQADLLIDAASGDIGPEPGMYYVARYYLDDVLEHTQTGISGNSGLPYTFSASGLARIEVEAVLGDLSSWQPAIAEFSYTPSPVDVRVTDAGDDRITDSGDRRTVE